MVGFQRKEATVANNQHPEPQPIPYQYELAVLGEECGEVMQIVGKTMRFGYDSHSPLDKDKKTNLALLHEEVGDILAAVDFAVERGLLDREKLVTRQFYKRRRLMRIAPQAPLLLLNEAAPGPHTLELMTELSVQSAEKPKPLAIVIAVVAITMILIAAVFLGSWLGGGMDDSARLEALRKADECYATVNDASCDDLARLAGEPPQEREPETKNEIEIDAGSR
jgi:NTP pyrophosphatase (non-canonical NTP hydrolase)